MMCNEGFVQEKKKRKRNSTLTRVGDTDAFLGRHVFECLHTTFTIVAWEKYKVMKRVESVLSGQEVSFTYQLIKTSRHQMTSFADPFLQTPKRGRYFRGSSSVHYISSCTLFCNIPAPVILHLCLTVVYMPLQSLPHVSYIGIREGQRGLFQT